MADSVRDLVPNRAAVAARPVGELDRGGSTRPGPVPAPAGELRLTLPPDRDTEGGALRCGGVDGSDTAAMAAAIPAQGKPAEALLLVLVGDTSECGPRADDARRGTGEARGGTALPTPGAPTAEVGMARWCVVSATMPAAGGVVGTKIGLGNGGVADRDGAAAAAAAAAASAVGAGDARDCGAGQNGDADRECTGVAPSEVDTA